MSIKDFLLRKLIKSKLKGVPEAEQEKLIAMVEKNPELFQKIALEAQEKIKAGQDQMAAMMDVMKKYEADLKKLM
ncbi:MAG TPA: hypothetical protein VK145_02585 [Candidatus Nanoarchaeia archaeon]|nr:hypothetical protein [Candidatus Nanoarchaeia archaeon]